MIQRSRRILNEEMQKLRGFIAAFADSLRKPKGTGFQSKSRLESNLKHQHSFHFNRPQSFSEIIGLQDIKKTLMRAVITRNPPSSCMVFFGQRGVGKTTLAKIFANKIACTNHEAVSCIFANCKMCKHCPHYVEINCNERSLDEIGKDVKKYSSYGSADLFSDRTVIILDEMNSKAAGVSEFLIRLVEDCPEVIFLICMNQEYITNIDSGFADRMTAYEFIRPEFIEIMGWLYRYSHTANIQAKPHHIFVIAKMAGKCPRQSLIGLGHLKNLVTSEYDQGLRTEYKFDVHNYAALVEEAKAYESQIIEESNRWEPNEAP